MGVILFGGEGGEPTKTKPCMWKKVFMDRRFGLLGSVNMVKVIG